VLTVGLIATLAACGSSTSRTAGHTTKTLPASTSTTPPRLALNMSAAPWPTPDQVPERVAAAGLPHSSTEALTFHYHSHLDIFVNGRSEPVGGSIGRVDQSFFSPLHTHAPSGLIHIEAPQDQRFTMAMLFTEWGVRMTDNCVGGYCRPTTRIVAYVNGKADRELFPTIAFTKGREIALVIGSPPASIPSNWDCAAEIDPTKENPTQCADFG
jgi:hypothetical protein